MSRTSRSRAPALPAAAQRRLLLHGQGLFDDPARKGGPAAVRRMVDRMGFVQLDSINVLARGHDLILAARFDDFRPAHLRRLLEQRRDLFEHWTHDASAISVAWFLPWRHRCRRMAANPRVLAWLARRMGRRWRATLDRVRERIRSEGPLMSRDFRRSAEDASSGSWWGWKPSKAALEFLWWRGDLSVTARRSFQKVYDLTERHFPDLYGLVPPPEPAYVDWACRQALERLVFATANEVSAFHGAVGTDEARGWAEAERTAGRLESVRLQGADDRTGRAAYALPDWSRRLRRAEVARGRLGDRIRLLSPFDPVIRDRRRVRRLFGFDYRFEAFVPAAQRQFGYYVLPLLRGEKLVGRCDAKLHRRQGELEIKGLWWEAGHGTSKRERRLFEEAAERLAGFVEAESLTIP